MATKTMGTNAQTTLTAMPFGTDVTQADIAKIQLGILNDLINGNPVYPGAWANTGLLYVPNRGLLQAIPGDYVAYDGTGWPILISKKAAASSSWVHT